LAFLKSSRSLRPRCQSEADVHNGGRSLPPARGMPESEILIVDDDAAVRDSLRALLESSGFAVREFASAMALLQAAGPSTGGCVIADVRMPDMDGLALQEELTRRQVGLPV